MLKALTFLGIGPRNGYQSTTYLKHDKSASCETHLFPEAVAKLYNPDQIIVFVTPEVLQDEKGYLKFLREQFNSQITIENIPNGTDETQLWKIFQTCADTVDEGDEIILDITHAFRSLPLLVFIVAAYLRQVKRVKLKRIIYGAYEARDAEINHTPVFDLTPFVELLDWTNAVNVLQSSGDARPIAALGVQDNISDALTGLSNALLTNRTLEAQEAAFKFNGLKFDNSPPPPFQMLIETLKRSYREMAVYEPLENPEKSLKKQYLQIKWYVENQHYLQAITLIREWLISHESLQQKRGDWLSQPSREKAQNALNERTKHQTSPFAQLTSYQPTTKLWEQCTEVRNDLAHCGMRNTPKPQRATKAIQAIQELFREFEAFVQQNVL